jgi:gliding motility-associated protein GldL
MSAGVSKSTEKLVNIIVCVGAAVVIFGAWQKITHQRLADFFLTAGLLTEALIFIVYAFLPPPGGEMHALAEALPKLAGAGAGNPSLQQMDKMMQEADITPTNLAKLSDGFNKFGTTVDKISDVSGALAATTDYTNKTKEAAVALDSMKNAYQGATATITTFNNAAESTNSFTDRCSCLTKNLGSLNTLYELIAGQQSFESNEQLIYPPSIETMERKFAMRKKHKEQVYFEEPGNRTMYMVTC